MRGYWNTTDILKLGDLFQWELKWSIPAATENENRSNIQSTAILIYSASVIWKDAWLNPEDLC